MSNYPPPFFVRTRSGEIVKASGYAGPINGDIWLIRWIDEDRKKSMYFKTDWPCPRDSRIVDEADGRVNPSLAGAAT